MYFHPARRGVILSVVPVRLAGNEDEWKSVRAATVLEDYHSLYGPRDGGAVELRTTNSPLMCTTRSVVLPSTSASAISIALRPICRVGCAVVVRGGSRKRAKNRSSKPTIDTSCGTFARPRVAW